MRTVIAAAVFNWQDVGQRSETKLHNEPSVMIELRDRHFACEKTPFSGSMSEIDQMTMWGSKARVELVAPSQTNRLGEEPKMLSDHIHAG